MDEDDRLTRMLALGGRLWARKKTILTGTVIGTILGVAYALLAPEIYMSQAVIYPKEVSATSEKSLLNGLGGTLNSLSAASHLNRVNIVLNSPELAEVVIRKQDLLPELMPSRRDASGRWKGEAPSPKDGVLILKRRLTTRVDTYKLTLEIKTRAGDAKTAHRIMRGYLDALNERMKENVIGDAAANREFLETQLAKTYDPWIRDKIQQLILHQVETGMLLNANAFEVLEGPSYPRLRESPVRKRIVLLFTAVSFGLMCGWVLVAQAIRNHKADGMAVRRAVPGT